MKLCVALLVVGMLVTSGAYAAEGMYVPIELQKKLDFTKLKKLGLTLDAKGIERLVPAIIKVAHGGTGSFVSKTGLLVTNHHVAYGCIAALSSTRKHWGILKKGYYAEKITDEIPCPGYDLMVVAEISDVTSQVHSVVKPKMTITKKLKAMRIKAEQLAEECAKKTGLHCEVKPYSGGAMYYLNKYMKITDVRLVFAPPSDLGKFGGDVDNWRYPRHTADFTFLRAYVSRKGVGVPFELANVPYQPKVFLKISNNHNPLGKINLVLGFPGRTNRFESSYSAKFQAEYATPLKRDIYGKIFQYLKSSISSHKLSKAKYASMIAGLANAEKYYQDSAKSMIQHKLVANKIVQENAIRSRLKGKDTKEYASLLSEIDSIFTKTKKFYKRYLLLSVMTRILPSVRGSFYIARWNRIKDQKSVERS
ncbi:S46 family peptidase, partial [Myxococcota bacterium]|nr:S46 family peptidase [Myxococcota bacterium]